MNRIKYKELFHIFERKEFEKDYLITLGLKTNTDAPTPKSITMNEKWSKIKDTYSCANIFIKESPNQVEDILTASYEKLTDLFVNIQDKNNQNGLKKSLSDIFNYNSFRDKIYSFFNKYLDLLDLCRCPYCDASFSGSYLVEKKSEKPNETESILTEKSLYDLDHFFPQSDYPIFALSLYNFIPSCLYCNMRIKNDGFIDFYKLDLSNPDETKDKLLESSPSSNKYNFKEAVHIRFIPNKNNLEDSNLIWHYAPLSQKTASKYKIYFDTQTDSQNQVIINSMKLEERYNSQAIKMNGLYLIDLKKRYPPSHIAKICKLLNQNNISSSESKLLYTEDQIENDIFHKDNKYALLQKLKNDLLE